jgi:peptidoglycan glycosyltransferase
LRAALVRARIAAWGLVALAVAAALVSWLALSSSAQLALGRERLLAGNATLADTAFARSERWPGARAAARAGRLVAAARAGGAAAEAVPLAALDALAPEALVLSSLDEGRLDAATAVADLARRAGHPVGSLYAAALALERGDEKAARAIAAESLVPMSSRGLGERLQRALDARDAGAARLLVDRHGELAATVSRGGAIEARAGLAPLVAGALERLPALPPGDDVRLSLDLSLSRAAREALVGRRGSIVLVEPRSGAVLAAVSDERTIAAEGAAAFVQRREPASIAKVLTAAAAYRAGIDADAAIGRMSCAGVERYDGKPLWCAWPAGPLLGLDHALAVSCNVAFANLGVRVGAGRLVEEYRRWGFDAGEEALLGASGRVHAPPRTPRQLADLSVGLELADVTPLHAALLAAVIANEGRLPEPALVTASCGPLGLADRPLPPRSGRDVLEPRTVQRLTQAMAAAAAYGTGAGLSPPGFPIAVKTGTAAEPGRGYHVNYVGVGPLPDPVVAFCVRVTNERDSPAVTSAARKVTRRLLAALADRRTTLEADARRAGRRAGFGGAR